MMSDVKFRTRDISHLFFKCLSGSHFNIEQKIELSYLRWKNFLPEIPFLDSVVEVIKLSSDWIYSQVDTRRWWKTSLEAALSPGRWQGSACTASAVARETTGFPVGWCKCRLVQEKSCWKKKFKIGIWGLSKWESVLVYRAVSGGDQTARVDQRQELPGPAMQFSHHSTLLS